VPLNVLAAAVLGVVAGPWLRGLIAARSVSFDQPLRTACVLSGAPAVTIVWAGIMAVAP
jgi:hypothetical protein